VEGVKNDRLAALLESAPRLEAGTPSSPEKIAQAEPAVRDALESNGLYRGQIASTTVVDRANSLVDLTYEVTPGNPARIGDVGVKGDSGLSEDQFRKRGKLKRDAKVTRNTVNRALNSLRKNYDKRGRLAASVSLTSKQDVPPTNRLNYEFLAHAGPLVKVKLQGARISKDTLQKLVPVYEEGAVDQDLLNEGAQNLRNYYQSHGYLRLF
jgi:outer membrane protein insertion porin family